ncbi:MAG: DUF4179 domain-containing protein [Eubacterium sp.]
MNNRETYKAAMSGVRHSDDAIERIFDMTVDNNKKKAFGKKHIIRIAAIATMVTIIAGATTVGAANYFVPDNSLNQMIELNDKIDYSTLGTDVNASASYNGIEFKIDKILCDNEIMAIPIKCPKYNGKYVKPQVISEEMDDPLKIFVNGKQQYFGTAGYDGSTEFVSIHKELQPDMTYLTITGLSNIRNNSKITIKFDRLLYFDGYDEICDVKGDWEFNFTINRSDTRKKLDVNDLSFENGEKCVAKSFTISPLGFEYEYNIKKGEPVTVDNDLGITLPKTQASGSFIFSNHLSYSLKGKAMIVITMKDGTVYTNGEDDYTIDSNCNFGENTILHKSFGGISATFIKAIDIDNIKTITILDKVLYESE